MEMNDGPRQNLDYVWNIDTNDGEPSDIVVFANLLSELYDIGWYGILRDDEITYFQSYMGSGRTLEIGSGTGRVSLPLLEAGSNLYGIEGSEAMFRALMAKLPSSERHRFIRWDGRKTPYPAEDGIFELIIVPFSTFGLMHNGLVDFGENRILREVYRLLSPGGHLIINDYRVEPFNRDKLNSPEPVWVHRHQHPEHGLIREDQYNQFLVLPNRIFEDQIVRERYTVFTRTRDGAVLEEHFERIPIWDTETFPILGQDAGFEYIRGEMCDFHADPSIHHVFRKEGGI